MDTWEDYDLPCELPGVVLLGRWKSSVSSVLEAPGVSDCRGRLLYAAVARPSAWNRPVMLPSTRASQVNRQLGLSVSIR